MTAIVQFSALTLVQTLGWTLLHFCWQGALLALLLACALAILPSRFSRLRYAAACAALLLMAASPLITFAVLATQTEMPGEHFVAPAFNQTQTLNVSPDQPIEPWTVRCERILTQLLPGFVAVWLIGVVILLCRLNLGLMVTRRMRLSAVEPASAELVNILRALKSRMGIERTVRLLNSALVQAPTVIGWLRPVILIPVGCMMALSPAQTEALLAHELAHIRRHDYLVSLFQMVVEALLFYHPAVWWVSNRMRREREHCCDDLAVALSGNRLAYAKALSFLEERRSSSPAGALAATGGVLKTRIARLLGVNTTPVFPHTAAIILLLVAATSAGIVALGLARAQSAPQKQSSSATQPETSAAGPTGPYALWLDQEVRWIITPDEKQAYLRLTNNNERQDFIEQFWNRRNPDPGSAENKFRREHYRRIRYADAHFAVAAEPGWQTDRGHVYIVYGPPDSIDSHPAGANGSAKPFETWHYQSIRIEEPAVNDVNGAGSVATRNNVDFRFVDDCSCGQYQLQSPWPEATASAPPHEVPASSAGMPPAQERSQTHAAIPPPNLAQPSQMSAQVQKLTIVSTDLPQSEQLQIEQAYEGKTYPLEELKERIRQSLRDLGYAEARAEIQNQPTELPPAPLLPIDVSVNISAGAKYRLSEIRIEGNRAFSSDEIFQQFPIHPEDMFNATAIGKGLSGLRDLYVSMGYTRVGIIPRLQMDKVNHTVVLTLNINEGNRASL